MGSLDQGVSEEKNVSMCPRACCDILVKNVVAFCSFLNNLPEVKLESLGLISVVEETSKQALVRTVLHGY